MNTSDSSENITAPNAPLPPDGRLKLPGARQSALIGLALVAAPAVFLSSMVMKHVLGVNLSAFDLVGDFFEASDKYPLTRHWFSPILFGLLPLIAVALNVRSILHLVYSPEHRLLTLTIKVRRLNLLVLLLASAVLGGVFIYQLAETFLVRG